MLIKKKILSFFLIITLFITFLPITSLGEDEKYIITDIGEKIDEVTINGIIDENGEVGAKPLYKVEVDSLIDVLQIKPEGNNFAITKSPSRPEMANSCSANDLTRESLLGTDDFYIENEALLKEYVNNDDSKKIFCLFGEAIGGRNKKFYVNGYLIVEWKNSNSVIIDKSTLETTINSAESLNVEDYYNENDRYNGKYEDTITNKTSGFWKNFQIKLEEAKDINTDESTSQDKVDEMVQNLNDAMERLIPKTQANITEIYEMLHANWYYLNNDILQKPDDYLGEELPIKEEYTSEYTWKKYQEVRDSAQDMIDSLYMADGQPTEINKGEYQVEVE